MALYGSKNTRHKGRKEMNKPYESGGKLNPPGANGSELNLNLNLFVAQINPPRETFFVRQIEIYKYTNRDTI